MVVYLRYMEFGLHWRLSKILDADVRSAFWEYFNRAVGHRLETAVCCRW